MVFSMLILFLFSQSASESTNTDAFRYATAKALGDDLHEYISFSNSVSFQDIVTDDAEMLIIPGLKITKSALF